MEEILELIAYGTGEAILYAMTLGRRKPKRLYKGNAGGVTQELLFSLSSWVGILFWGSVLTLSAWLVRT